MAFISGALLTLGTMIGLGATGLSVFVGVGMFAIKTAVGVGLNLLAQAIAGKPQDPKFSVNGNLQSGGDLPRSIKLGYGATAGSLVYANTWGRDGESDNAFLTQVIALSDYPVRELRELWVNGEHCTLGGSMHPSYGYPVTQYQTDGRDHLWVKFYDGTQVAADPFLVSVVSSAERPYESTRVGRGVAYAVVTSLVTKNLFSGIPSFKFSLYGARLYDPSRDSTVGGFGLHSEADPSTWGGDGDFLPAVQIYNLLRGMNYGGKWLYGVQGMSSVRLPAAHWIEQINKCRAPIYSAEGYVPTYRSGGEIAVDAPLGDAIEALLTTCQGRLTESGGIYKLYCGVPGNPVASFTDGDILSTEEQSFTPFFGLADTINGISARYPSPAEGWNPKVAPPLYRPDLEALAGNRRLMANVSLDFVPYAEQVQRLMKSALDEAQRARRHTFVLPPQYWVLEPGDIVSWTSARNGYSTKLFRVDGVVDRANLDVMLDLTEVDPSDYDWDSDADFQPPVDGSVGPVRPTPQPIIDWYAEPWQIDDANGNARRVAIKLSWNGDQPDVAAVAFEVALAETLEIFHRGRTDEVAVGSVVTSQGLLANEDYLVRGRYVPESDRGWVWSSWLPVKTLNIRLGDADVYLPGMVEEILEQVGEITEFADYGAREALEQARQIVATDGASAGYDHLESRRVTNNVSVQIGETRAYVNEEIFVAVGPTSAIAIQLNEQRAEYLDGIASNTSLISTEVSLVDGRVTAIGGRIDLLEVEVDGVAASVTVRSQVGASPGAGIARHVIMLKVDTLGTMVQAGLFIDIAGGVGSVGALANRFYVVDPSTLATSRRPFVVQGGVLYADELRVRRANIVEFTATWAEIKDAVIENLDVTSAMIGFATIEDGNIAAGAVTNQANNSGSISLPPSTNWVPVTQITIASPSGNPVLLYFNVQVTNSGTGVTGTTFRLLRNNVVIRTASGSATLLNASELMMDAAGAGTFTYVIEAQRLGGTGGAGSNGSLIATCNKK